MSEEFKEAVMKLRDTFKQELNGNSSFSEVAPNTFTHSIIHAIRKNYYDRLLEDPMTYGVPNTIRDLLYIEPFYHYVENIMNIVISGDDARIIEHKILKHDM